MGGWTSVRRAMSSGAQPARGGSRMTVEELVIKSSVSSDLASEARMRPVVALMMVSDLVLLMREPAGRFWQSSRKAKTLFSTRVRLWSLATERPMVPTPE